MHFSRTMTNKELARAFRQVMAVYQIQGMDLFHVRAYQNAASSIELYTTPLFEIWQEGKLEEVPGIGEKFAGYLDELFRTGTIKHFEKILAQAPTGMFPLLDVPGIGPKTAWKLASKLNLRREATALSKLRAALGKGVLDRLLSPKVKQRIIMALSRRREDANRMLIIEAEEIASDFTGYLATCPQAKEIEVLGSLRRRVSTIGDIDIAVATREPQRVMEYVRHFPHIKKIISYGEKTTSFVHSSGVQIDVKTSLLESWGDMLVHYTGGKLHNIHLRTVALERGMSVSEFGVTKSGVKKEHKTEKELYSMLGLSFIPPELREDAGEIEAARTNTIPQLIEESDIKGDLHVHSHVDYPSSHDMGADSLSSLLATAQELGYAYLGVSDHNPKHVGLTTKERLSIVTKRNDILRKEYEQYKHSAKGVAPHLLIGMEVDILPDGALALEDEALSTLDYAIVSIHSQFTLESGAQTQRILRALSHSKAAILGHPTGRHLLLREQIHCNWQEVFAFCAKQQKLLEINAAPVRLDLPDVMIRQAKEAGVRFVIDTDAHRASDMRCMKYGVWTARRGWATKKDIVTTLPFSQLRSHL